MKKKKQHRGRWAPFVLLVTVAVLVIAAIVAVSVLVFGGSKTAPESTTAATTTQTDATQSQTESTQPETTTAPETTTEPETTAATTKPATSADVTGNAAQGDVSVGSLVLVNADHLYSFPDVEKVHMTSDTGYTMAYDTLYMNKECYTAFQSMCADFSAKYPQGDLLVISGFRTYQRQKELFQNSVAKNGSYEAARKWTALPGASDHHTGYAFDFSLDYEGDGIYSWIRENCYRYGFVVRFEASKSAITGISNEPWHFRYVGVPHAYYMMQNNLCLEEYIDLLYDYPENGQHLTFTYEDGTEYEVYYVKGTDLSDVKKPAGDYTISGNNIDGFIVTIAK